MLTSISIVVGYICLATQACIWSNRTLDVVESCPSTKEETRKAARIKRCDAVAWKQNCTKPSQFKYHCLYSYRQKTFVEVCSTEINIHGVCIVYDTSLSRVRPVYNARCRDILSACPETYLSTEGHLHATCPQLMNMTFFDTKGTDNNPQHPINESQILLYLAVLLPIFIIIIIGSIFFYKLRKKRHERETEMELNECGISSEEETLFPKTWASNSHHHKVHPDIEVQEEGDTLHFRVTTQYPPDDNMIRWQKDGIEIDCTKNTEKYLSFSVGKNVDKTHGYLYIYDTTDIDSGLYRASWTVDGEEYQRDILWNKGKKNTMQKKSGKRMEKSEILLRQHGNNLRIRVTTNQRPSDVKWWKDGEILDCSKNPNFLSIIGNYEDEKHFYLYIFNFVREYSGSYYASWTKDKDTFISRRAKIYAEALILMGPNIKVEKDRTISQKIDDLGKIKFPIFPLNGTYHLIITEIEASTREIIHGTLCAFTDDGVPRLLLFGMLLNEKHRISWSNEQDIQHLNDVKILMEHKEPIIEKEYKAAASELSCKSIQVEKDGISFLYEDIEIESMWTLMQYPNAKEKILWLFERKKKDLVKKYFRTSDYKRHKDEVCVLLPEMLTEDFQEFLIEQLIQELGTGSLCEQQRKEMLEMKRKDYVFNQRQSTLLQCVIYYSFMVGDKTSKSLVKYFRSSGYESQENEVCICIPAEYNNDLIRKLDIDILIHKTISDTTIHADICKLLHVPVEILKWNLNQRRRYLKHMKIGNIEMYRARGMIVGCAGAGKTTLLRRLQRRSRSNFRRETQTTLGLEIHNNIFTIEKDTLIDYEPEDNELQFNTTSFSLNCQPVNLLDDVKLLSLYDFAGQVAYYACHQVYLSRRAFYLLVVDMSKNLKEVAYQKYRHDPMGSLFENWTYQDFFVFWLRSIKTYCDDIKLEEKYGDRAEANPVIIIASHRDCLKKGKKRPSKTEHSFTFYDALENCLPKEHHLKEYISNERYFEIECPKGVLNDEQAQKIKEIKQCIVKTAENLPHWGEKIPVQWSIFEHFVWANKRKKIVDTVELKKLDDFSFMDDNDIDDMLRFYHEIGQILYFSDKGLRENIILDVQWFVDAFRYIITDPTHVRPFCRKVKDWELFMKTGRISDSTLHKVWRKNNNDSYVSQRDKIMPYMEKLGILAKVQTQIEHAEVQSEKQTECVYYIPSINKNDTTENCWVFINKGNKTPILVFSFKTYIPHFFFYRLVVACFAKWESLSDDLFCRNLALYKEKGGDRNIAIGVNRTSIQLQVFTPSVNIELMADKTREIRKYIDSVIKELATTFHQKVLYEIGYVCKALQITEEDEDCFLSEEIVKELETNERVCPRYYERNHEEHNIVRDNLLHYWHQIQEVEEVI